MLPFSRRHGPECDDVLCTASRPRAASAGTLLSLALSLSPFVGTFAIVSLLVARRVTPLLSRAHGSGRDDGDGHVLPAFAPTSLRQCHAERASRGFRRRLVAGTFASTIGLSAVLAELILVEISDLVDPVARDLALRVTVPTLLFLLVALIPFLEVQSVVAGSGLSFNLTAKGRVPRTAWVLQLAAFGAWLFVFWSLGLAVPGLNGSYIYARDEGAHLDSTGISMAMRGGFGSAPDFGTGVIRSFPGLVLTAAGRKKLARACLERVGVIGISLMALLSGFASVSSPWHTFADHRAHKRRPVTDAQISRKQAGLEATGELLVAKRHRLRSLQRQVAAATVGGGEGPGATAPAQPLQTSDGGSSGVGLVGKLIGSIKTSLGARSEQAEIKALELEIAGLESMEASLSAGVSALRSRRASLARAGTVLGRILMLPSYVFSLYCVYRVLATTMTTLRRMYNPGASFSSSDPINRFLGLLAKHWDPKLDQLAWARQISFLLSGVILAASANSVLQTFRLFSKWAPGLVYQAQANLALFVGQIAATYVISSSLLLRSSLPKEVSGAVSDALESALEPAFVDRWFEGWFLVASIATAIGIWAGGRISGGHGADWDEWDDFAREEIGQKRS